MTLDDTAKLARKAGWSEEMGADLWGAAFDGAMSIHALQRFASMAAAAERERFAQECIDIVALHGGSVEIEAAIRARGQS